MKRMRRCIKLIVVVIFINGSLVIFTTLSYLQMHSVTNSSYSEQLWYFYRSTKPRNSDIINTSTLWNSSIFDEHSTLFPPISVNPNGSLKKSGQIDRYPKHFHNDFNGWLDNWKQVDKDVYIYSAYQDQRLRSKEIPIRVIALVRRTKSLALQCVLHKSGESGWYNVSAGVRNLPESHNTVFTAAYIRCNSAELQVQLGIGTTLGAKSNSTPDPVTIPVHQIFKDVHQEEELAVCVRPLFGPFSDTLKLAEFIAYYELMGATHFSFYDFNTSSEAVHLLKELSANGLSIDFIEWNLPIRLKQVHAHGQLAFIQDCVYRHMNTFRYVLLVDLDEFIVPRKHFSIVDLVAHINRNFKKPIGAYLFLHSFFCVNRTANKLLDNGTIPLTTETFTKREVIAWPANYRSKVIIRTRAADITMIHQSYTLMNKWKTHVVSVDLARLHHYRPNACLKAKNETLTTDGSATVYSSGIRNSRAMRVWKGVTMAG